MDIMSKDIGEILADYFRGELSDSDFCEFVRDTVKLEVALDEALEVLAEVVENPCELAADHEYFNYIKGRADNVDRLYFDIGKNELTVRNLRDNKELVTGIRAILSKQDEKP